MGGLKLGAPAVFNKELMSQHLHFGARAIQYSCRINTVHTVCLQDHLTIPAMDKISRDAYYFCCSKVICAHLALALPPPPPSAWR